jgi:pimeloyl-ACP methyl ester carboxylesterase
MFEYGSPSENMKHYNQSTPPLYDISKIQVPTALYYGQNDWLADVNDVDFLKKSLPNIVDDLNIKIYNHADFIWGTNTKEVLYDRMIQLMQKY